MKIGDREVVPTKLGWADAETGELLVSIRGLSIPKDQPKIAKKTKKTKKVEDVETPVGAGLNAVDVVQEPAAEQEIEASTAAE